mgnify:CR=1 FL=1
MFQRTRQKPEQPRLTVLCRNLEQVRVAAAEPGIDWIYANFEFIKQYPAAVQTVRDAGKRIALAVPRIHMPGENGYFEHILRLKPDGVLIRNLGAMYSFSQWRINRPDEHQPELIGDFSLNIANHRSAALFLRAGPGSPLPMT